MAWPVSQDYNEAIQSPAANFADADLKCGEAVTNALGLPMPFSGNFADVYEVIRRSAATSARQSCPSPWTSTTWSKAFASRAAGTPWSR